VGVEGPSKTYPSSPQEKLGEDEGVRAHEKESQQTCSEFVRDAESKIWRQREAKK